MRFLIRQISHSAEGREIVRPSRIEGERLTIGRDPSSHIHLTDLAVALHHATIERTGPDRLAVAAGEKLQVELDGRKVGSGAISLGTGGEIRIASHLLRVLPAAHGAEEIAIDVERITDAGAGADKADARRFALAAVMPGKRPLSWVLAALVLGLFVAWPIWTFYESRAEEAPAERFRADRMWMAGSLSQVHSDLEKNCTACHTEPFVAVRDQACLSCHTGIHDHADPFRLAAAGPQAQGWGKVRLAFQQAFNRPPGRCVDCHTEHQGPQEMTPTPQRFCSDCHAGLSERLPDTRLGDAGDFGRQHPEFQPSVLVRWEGERPVMQRVPLDRQPRENSNLKFPHDLHLAPAGGVARMARRLAGEHGFGAKLECADCHVPTPDGVRFQPVDMEGDCAMCHSLAFDRVGGTVRTLRHGAPAQVVADLREFYRGRTPPRPQALGETARRRPGDAASLGTALQFNRALAAAPARAEQAIRAVFSPGGACFDCHQVQGPRPGTLDYRIRPVAFPVRYMHKGWFDHRPHQQEACSSCHAAEGSSSATDLLLPDLASCRTCHGGEGSRSPVPSTCAMCHDYHMDEGTPSLLLRQRVRGRRWETTVIAVEPKPAAGR
jgi:hypothetical protein